MARETSGAGRVPRCLLIPSNSTNVQASGQTVGYCDHDDILVCLCIYNRELLPIADSSSMPATQINEEQQVMFGHRNTATRGQLIGKHVQSTATVPQLHAVITLFGHKRTIIIIKRDDKQTN